MRAAGGASEILPSFGGFCGYEAELVLCRGRCANVVERLAQEVARHSNKCAAPQRAWP